jgi:hypothetical protein
MVRVIGAGFGRTGTDSMREALDILGFGPCHHMRELFADPAHRALWRDLNANLDDGGPVPTWDALLGRYGSCIDWPSAAYWPRLVTAYPAAKVILTWRTPESWWESFSRTILPMVQSDMQTPQPRGADLLVRRVFGGRLDLDHCIAAYTANVALARATVPPGRLLVHAIGDGWDPVCAFLGVPVPAVPYPSSNTAADFNRALNPGSRS